MISGDYSEKEAWRSATGPRPGFSAKSRGFSIGVDARCASRSEPF
jgi:hypothetical protein